jgi:RND family efflux transporter MFP subunit
MNTNRESLTSRRLHPQRLVGLLALLAVLLIAIGLIDRHRNLTELRQVAREDAAVPVQVIHPARSEGVHVVTLPGNIRAWYSAPIYAQVPGYVLKWYTDYGAPVKAGALLATIDAPAVDEQYESARANLEVAKTNSQLANVTAARWKSLAGTEAVSQQDVDIKTANAAAQKARVDAAEHQVARYRVLEGFKKIVAPFDGVVTSRNVDVGNYVNAAGGDVGSRGTADELFTVADIHEMRVFVSVPQDYSSMLKPGLEADLSLPQYPGKIFKARLETTAHAFDPQTRTVVTELLVPNPDHLIWPGTYADVHFKVPLDPNVLIVPEQALLFRSQGMQVAVVDASGKVHLKDVALGNNLGQSVEVLSGIAPSDRIVMSPSAGLLDGDTVRVEPGVPGIRAAAKFEAPASDTLDPAAQAKVQAALGNAK